MLGKRRKRDVCLMLLEMCKLHTMTTRPPNIYKTHPLLHYNDRLVVTCHKFWVVIKRGRKFALHVTLLMFLYTHQAPYVSLISALLGMSDTIYCCSIQVSFLQYTYTHTVHGNISKVDGIKPKFCTYQSFKYIVRDLDRKINRFK